MPRSSGRASTRGRGPARTRRVRPRADRDDRPLPGTLPRTEAQRARPFPGAPPFMPRAQNLRAREHVAEFRGVRFYRLDAEDQDLRCAAEARRLAGAHGRFYWFWFRPDVTPGRTEHERWDRQPGVPFVAPPEVGERIPWRDATWRVVQRVSRYRHHNYGWVVLGR